MTRHSFDSFGYIMEDVPKDLFDDLSKVVHQTKAIGIRANNSLAGNIEEEYQIPNKFIDQSFRGYLQAKVREYEEQWPLRSYYNGILKDERKGLDISNCWVNFQKKGEYNPVHDHGGVYSFVIWVKVPYCIKEEQQLKNSVDSNMPSNGAFCFHYVNTLGLLSAAKIEPTEGKMLFFPSRMNHGVSPFYTSDDYRISISGNLNFY